MASSLSTGAQVTGRVSQLAHFGAFIALDNAGWEGLVFIYEISWFKIQHPSDVLVVGQEIRAQVLRFVPEQQRILLSIKRCSPNPWQLAAAQFRVGELVEVIVSEVVDFGAFACLKDYPALIGILPGSEIRQGDLQVGEVLRLRLATFEPDKERLRFQNPSPNPPCPASDSGPF